MYFFLRRYISLLHHIKLNQDDNNNNNNNNNNLLIQIKGHAHTLQSLDLNRYILGYIYNKILT